MPPSRPGLFVPQEDEQQPIPEGMDEMMVNVAPPPATLPPQGGVVDISTGMPVDDVPEITGAEDILDQPVFGANLADQIEPSALLQIAEDIVRWVDTDRQAMADWRSKLGNGLEVLGVKELPASKAAFKGAAAVNFPLLAEAIVQFQARAIDELFPPSGPVKAVTMGNFEAPPELQEMAAQDPMAQQQMQSLLMMGKAVEAKRKRVEDYMNYHLTEEDEEYFDECDQMLFYLPLAGSAFMKVYRDEALGLNVSRFVRGEDLIVPYTATNLRNAPRYTHVYHMTHTDLRRLQVDGYFADVDVPEPSTEDPGGTGRDDLTEATDDAEGRKPTYEDKDYRHTIYECHCELDLPGFEDEKIKLPYVVSMDVESRQVLRVVRNWKPDDVRRRKRVWFAHRRYMPGLGFYGFGLLHFIGSVTTAASAAVNTLLNAGAFASMQGGFKTKEGAGIKGGTFTLEPGVYKEVDASYEDLQKAFWSPPFKEPSQALVEMLGLLIDTTRRFASTTEAMTGEGDAKNAPVGSIVALIEQAQKVFSAIHKRGHQAARKEFKMLAELHFEHLPVEGYPYHVAGDPRMVFADDFDKEVDVIPVSDPNIHSATQRVAVAEAVLQTAVQAPDRVNADKAIARFFEALRVPNYQELIVPPEQRPAMPDPEAAKAEAEIAIKREELALKKETGRIELEQKKAEFALEMELKRAEMELKIQLAQQQHQVDMQLAQMKGQQMQQQSALDHEMKMKMLADKEQAAAISDARAQRRKASAANGGGQPGGGGAGVV
jgi:hypothetical protein